MPLLCVQLQSSTGCPCHGLSIGLISIVFVARLTTGKGMVGISYVVTHLFSLQPALGKSSAPFRLPQNHMLFGCLSETVSKGETESAVGLEEMGLGCETACAVAGMCGTWLPLLIRLCPAKW